MIPQFAIRLCNFLSAMAMGPNPTNQADAWGSCSMLMILGLELDGTGFGMGVRSKRYAMIIDHGKVSFVAVDEKGFELSSAEAILAALD